MQRPDAKTSPQPPQFRRPQQRGRCVTAGRSAVVGAEGLTGLHAVSKRIKLPRYLEGYEPLVPMGFRGRKGRPHRGPLGVTPTTHLTTQDAGQGP